MKANVSADARENGVTAADLPAQRLPFFLLAFVCVFAPFPLGSVHPWWVAVFCIPAAFALATVNMQSVDRRTRVRLAIFAALSGIVAIVFLYDAVYQPITPAVLIAQETAALLGLENPGRPPIVAANLFNAAGPLLLGACVFMTALALGDDRNNLTRLIWIIAISAAVYALLAATLFGGDPSRVLWLKKSAYRESFTGTFVNRNTAATYFGTGLLCWLMLILREVDRVRQNVGDRLSRVIRVALGTRLARFSQLGLGFSITLVALVATGSRAGTTLTAIAALSMSVIYIVRTGLPRRFAYILLGASLGYALLIMQLNGSLLMGRIAAQDVGAEKRWIVYEATLRIIGEYPWTGIGPGNFSGVFQLYRPPELGILFVWDSAHSTPLQLMAELGIPAAILICCWWLYVIAALLRGALTRKSRFLLPTLGFGVALLGLAHTSIDFSLEIAGYAVVFLALVGMSLGQTASLRKPQAEAGTP